jgi:hypothetical protein
MGWRGERATLLLAGAPRDDFCASEGLRAALSWTIGIRRIMHKVSQRALDCFIMRRGVWNLIAKSAHAHLYNITLLLLGIERVACLLGTSLFQAAVDALNSPAAAALAKHLFSTANCVLTSAHT